MYLTFLLGCLHLSPITYILHPTYTKKKKETEDSFHCLLHGVLTNNLCDKKYIYMSQKACSRIFIATLFKIAPI